MITRKLNKDIAAQAGVPVPNIRVWFYSTGKKMKEIKKAGRAMFRWDG